MTNQDLSPTEPIILIGPMKAGKSTVGKLLAAQLDWPFVSLDWVEEEYMKPVGYDEAVAVALEQSQDYSARYTYRRSFFDEAVIGFLADHSSSVLELGGGHPILPTEAKQRRVNQALAPYQYVVLLMPAADIETSLKILNARQKPENREPDLNKMFLADNRFFELAKLVVYTDGQSPEESCQEILARLSIV